MFCLEKGFNHLCDVTITDFTIRMGVGLKKWNSWLLYLGCNQFEFITQRVHGFVVRPLSFKVHILKETTKDMNPRLKTKSFFFSFWYTFRYELNSQIHHPHVIWYCSNHCSVVLIGYDLLCILYLQRENK
jgi:hypothetical protein